SYDGSTTVSWSASGSLSPSPACEASGGTVDWGGWWPGTGGSATIGSLENSVTFSMTCSGPGGVTTASVTVAVAPWASLSASPSAINQGASSTLNWYSNGDYCNGTWNPGVALTASGTANVAPTTSTTYTVQCAKGNVSSRPSSAAVTVTPRPTVTVSASPNAVPYGSATTLSWSSTNATYCQLSWTGGSVDASGTARFEPVLGTTSPSVTC